MCETIEQQWEYRQARVREKEKKGMGEPKSEMVISEAQRALGPHAVARFTISRAHLTVVLVSLS